MALLLINLINIGVGLGSVREGRITFLADSLREGRETCIAYFSPLDKKFLINEARYDCMQNVISNKIYNHCHFQYSNQHRFVFRDRKFPVDSNMKFHCAMEFAIFNIIRFLIVIGYEKCY